MVEIIKNCDMIRRSSIGSIGLPVNSAVSLRKGFLWRKNLRLGLFPCMMKSRRAIGCCPAMWRGVDEAGGIPVILPLSQQGDALAYYAEAFDGFLFPGGHDLNPVFYGGRAAGRPAARSARSAMRWNADCFLWCLQRKNLCWGSAGVCSCSMSCWAGRFIRTFPQNVPAVWSTMRRRRTTRRPTQSVWHRIPRCSLAVQGRADSRKQLSSRGGLKLGKRPV